MGKITRLAPHVANRIAAGEVVERPASVLKELVENALDAGARRVEVDIEGGAEALRVRDDGEGMDAEDARLSFERHATSKLPADGPIGAIRTYGFRGEALAAVAAVAEVELLTRTPSAPVGVRVLVRGGQELAFGPAPCAPGTRVSVRRLFFNTPARRRFLRTPAAERRACLEMAERMALARPDVTFHVAVDGRLRLHAPGDGQARSAAAAVLGPDRAAALLAGAAARGPVAVTALMGPPGEHRPDRRELWVFVNGRWVEDRLVQTAAARAYESALPAGRYPVGLIYLSVDPERLDVNVHPAKRHVRFADEDLIFSAVVAAVKAALCAAPAPAFSRPGIRDLPAQQSPPTVAILGPDAAGQALPQVPGSPVAPGRFEAAGKGGHEGLARERTPAYGGGPSGRLFGVEPPRVLGQIFLTYIVAEGPAGLLIVDQHVAHERLIYERLKRAWHDRTGPVPSQALMEPVRVQLSPARSQALEDLLEPLAALGVVVEPFGPTQWRVRAVPVEPGLAVQPDPGALAELLSAVADAGPEALGPGEADRLLKTVACRSAVKAGQTLAANWMNRLVEELGQADNPYTCPHGRPVVVRLSLDELHRRFGRPAGR